MIMLNGMQAPEPRIAQTRGRELLLEWMGKDSKRSQSAIARALGVSQPAVHMWLTGHTVPSSTHRKAIERLAGIPEDDWQTDKEAARLAETLSNIEAADVA